MKKDKKLYMERPWFLVTFNEGYEIGYIDEHNFSQPIPLESQGIGHSEDLELLEYIIAFHNNKLKSEKQ